VSLAQSKFLLDANLSPKIARYLARQHRLDVKWLLSIGLAQIPDNQVLAVAARENRVIITLDQDFEDFFFHSARAHQPGIRFLDLRAGLTNNVVIYELVLSLFL
jgi:predicted nuclease of predicted toxin-antitoxin system